MIKSKLCKKIDCCFNQKIIKSEIKIKAEGSPNQISKNTNPPKPMAKIKRDLNKISLPGRNLTNFIIKTMTKAASKIERVSFKKERGSKETFWLSFIFKNLLALKEEIVPRNKVKINKKASQNKTLLGLKIGCSIFSSSTCIFSMRIAQPRYTLRVPLGYANAPMRIIYISLPPLKIYFAVLIYISWISTSYKIFFLFGLIFGNIYGFSYAKIIFLKPFINFLSVGLGIFGIQKRNQNIFFTKIEDEKGGLT